MISVIDVWYLKDMDTWIALNGTPMTELWDVTYHSVTWCLTQLNTPRPNPSPQVDTWFTYPGGMEG